MATIIYEDVNPTLIENTVMQLRKRDGVATNYTITPVGGYVLHDNFSDWTDIDPNTMEETFKLGYVSGSVSIGANYDFVENPRGFYAVLRDSVPTD